MGRAGVALTFPLAVPPFVFKQEEGKTLVVSILPGKRAFLT